MHKERSMLLVVRYGPSVALILVCILATSYVVTTLQKKLILLNAGPQMFPIHQLERAGSSRKQTLTDLKRILEFSNTQRLMKNTRVPKVLMSPEGGNEKFLFVAEKSLDIMHAFGFYNIVSKFGYDTDQKKQFKVVPDSLSLSGFLEMDNDTKKPICHDLSFSTQETKHTTDPTFCSRLLKLKYAINSGKEPPLLTLFTWWPDPITDVEKNSRKIMFRNWKFLEPFVQPVLFSDSRMNMAQGNTENVPCLPVPEYSPDGVPLFRNMSAVAQGQFQSTFYCYVRATSIFDVSLLKTLLAIKELYDTNSDEEDQSQAKEEEEAPSDNKGHKPILVYGKAAHMSDIGYVKDFCHVTSLAQNEANFTWEDIKKSMIYLIYKDQDFKDMPSLTIDDKYLTPSLVARSRAKGHDVIDASNTIISIFNVRNKTTSEWGREYIRTKPRDPHYNKKLFDQYMEDLSREVPGKWSDEIYAHFDKNGRVFMSNSEN